MQLKGMHLAHQLCFGTLLKHNGLSQVQTASSEVIVDCQGLSPQGLSSQTHEPSPLSPLLP